MAIGAGPVVLTQLLRAADLLADDGVDLTVVNLPWNNRVDQVWLSGLAADADWLFVVEDQYARGGQADMLARELLELCASPAPRFHGIGLTGIPQCGTEDEVLSAHGLRADVLAATVRDALSGNGDG
nr:transketolase C-terminal domain-containing protein [Streptomyces antimycoticus]